MATATPTPERPAWSSRLLAVTFYLGLAPLLAHSRLPQQNTYLQHHYGQAVAVVGILVCILLGGLAGFIVGAYLLVYHPDVHDACSVEAIGNAVFGVFLALWGLLWLLGVALAVKGSIWAVPFLRRLSDGWWTFRAALIGNVGLDLVAVTTIAMTLHAVAISRADAGPAPVYMLYDSGNTPVPRWAFALGFYRISLAAQERWGPGSVVVAPLTQENFDQAIRHGRFVFLASHGAKGNITTPLLHVMPAKNGSDCFLWSIARESRTSSDWRPGRVHVGDDLRIAYITACGSSDKQAFWQAAFDPAEVFTFPPNSAVGQHILWMWLDGPARVRLIDPDS